MRHGQKKISQLQHARTGKEQEKTLFDAKYTFWDIETGVLRWQKYSSFSILKQ
jgi:hypothetical protein